MTIRKSRVHARTTAALLLALTLAACGGPAATVPTTAPATTALAPTTAPAATSALAPTTAPAVAPAPATAPTAASQSESSPVEFVRELVTPEQPIKHPAGVAVDAQGNVYISDSTNDRIVKLDSAGKFVKTWGSRGTDDGQFMFVQPDRPEQWGGSLAVDNQGNVYISDAPNNPVQKFDA